MTAPDAPRTEARSMVCAIADHFACDGNAPNGPAGVGHPCACRCHVAPRTEAPDLRAAVQAWLDAVDEARRYVDHDGSLEVNRLLMERRLRAALSATPAPERLDVAWAEAEAALPRVWPTHRVGGGVHHWNATATAEGPTDGWTGEGPTPAAALRALAARLRESGS